MRNVADFHFLRQPGPSGRILFYRVQHLILDDSISEAIHANSAKQGLARFTSRALQSVIELLYRTIKSNIPDSLHVVIQIERRPRRRYISEVPEINSYYADGDPFDYCAIYQRQEPSQ